MPARPFRKTDRHVANWAFLQCLQQASKANQIWDKKDSMLTNTMDGHHDAVSDDHRHSPRQVGDELWTFDHIQAFAMKVQIEQPSGLVDFDVVVLFSNHCYSREEHLGEAVDESLIVMDGSIRRVLDRQRYALSRQHLPQLVHDLPNRHIRIADASRPNFVTLEIQPATPDGAALHYAMFFEVKRDRTRKRRMLLRVQSAYLLESPSRRLLNANKMRFHVILKRAL